MIEELINCLGNNDNTDKLKAVIEETYLANELSEYANLVRDYLLKGASSVEAIELTTEDRLLYLKRLELEESELEFISLTHSLSTNTTSMIVTNKRFHIVLVSSLMINQALSSLYELIREGELGAQDLHYYIEEGVLVPISVTNLEELNPENETTQVSDIPPNNAEVQINIGKSDRDGYKLIKFGESTSLVSALDTYNSNPVLGIVLEYDKDSNTAYIEDKGLISKLNDDYLVEFIKTTVLSGISLDGADAKSTSTQDNPESNKAYFKDYNSAKEFIVNNKLDSKIYGCTEGYFVYVG